MSQRFLRLEYYGANQQALICLNGRVEPQGWPTLESAREWCADRCEFVDLRTGDRHKDFAAFKARIGEPAIVVTITAQLALFT